MSYTAQNTHDFSRRSIAALTLALLLIGSPVFALAAQPAVTIRPSALRCDARVQPLGVQTAIPSFSWIPVAMHSGMRNLRQSGYQLLVASSPSSLARNDGNMWNSGRINGLSGLRHTYAGHLLTSHTMYWWKVRLWDQNDHASAWSTPQSFTMGLLHTFDWTARWITASPKVLGANPQTSAAALPIFRRDFRIHGQVKQAILFISGLGQYDAHLNGVPVTTSVLNPGWTNYHETILYNTFNVTSRLRQGRNVIAVLLGNGMYNVPKTSHRYQKFKGTFGPPKLIAQLVVTFADGRTETIATGSQWKTAKSPIIFSQTYGGEDYDGRILPNWDQLSLNDSSWANAIVAVGPGGTLQVQRIPPIRVMHIYHPVRVTKVRSGVYVYDLGQNFSGWPIISAEGPAGSSVKLIPGEQITKSGLVSQRSMGGGPIWFTYILNGHGIEHWHPRFSYTGFRYVQVETIPAPGSTIRSHIRSLSGAFVHSSAPVVGSFHTSDVLFNRIHRLIDMAIKSNTQSLLTDCPHREKLGWLEQTHLMGTALFYGHNLDTLYQKMANDIAAAQRPNGLVPEIAPEYVIFGDGFRDSPEWGSAVILSAWTDYRFTGDPRILSTHYSAMQAYLNYLGREAKGHILSEGLGDWYDLGPKPPGYAQLTGMKVTATATYYRDLTVMQKIATLLGNPIDATYYRNLAAEVKASYNRELLHPGTNEYDRGSQTANGMSLAVGLVPRSRRAAVLKNLVANIRAHDNHLTSGEIGFHYVLEALREGGRSDVICDMLSQTTPPSYDYQLEKGATTLTEAWNANPANSQDHFMLGDAEQWFYRGLAGINFDLARSRESQIVLRPQFVCGIASASAWYQSDIGRIAISWHRNATRTQINATIPVGQTALIYIPGAAAIPGVAAIPGAAFAGITESGHPILKSAGVTWLRSNRPDQIFRLQSGVYHFVSRRTSMQADVEAGSASPLSGNAAGAPTANLQK